MQVYREFQTPTKALKTDDSFQICKWGGLLSTIHPSSLSVRENSSSNSMGRFSFYGAMPEG